MFIIHPILGMSLKIRVEENPTKGMGGRGVNRTARWGTVVDESRKEMVDRVARHQTDEDVEQSRATSATNWWGWLERGLPMSSLFVLFFFFLALILSDVHFFCFSSFFLLILWRGWMMNLLRSFRMV